MMAKACSQPRQQKLSSGPSTAVPQWGQRETAGAGGALGAAASAMLGEVGGDNLIGPAHRDIDECDVHQDHQQHAQEDRVRPAQLSSP